MAFQQQQPHHPHTYLAGLFDLPEDHSDCVSPTPGYAPFNIPGPHCSYYPHQLDYRTTAVTSWPAPALPEAAHYQTKFHAELYRNDSAHSLVPWALDSNSASSSSTYSVRHDSPAESDIAAMSPDYYYEDAHGRCFHTRTTSMSDIQNFPDHNPEQLLPDHEHMYSMYIPHDGYVPRDVSTDISSMTVPTPQPITVEAPSLRSRRSAARSTNVKPATNNRVSKRSPPKRSATFTTAAVDDSDVDDEIIPPRPFHCPLAPYGCESTFGSKNEWKRHLSTQHLRLEYWRCDECQKPNDFNRRDLFTQHVRRMHANKAPPQQTNRRGRSKPVKNEDAERQVLLAAQRCYRRLRNPPTRSICIICSQSFSGENSWDERMEHLGRHFEGAKKENVDNTWPLDVGSWVTDLAVENWMVDHGILSQDRRLIVTTDDHKD